jgi:3D (Asp-Asp-Asp) domain-containing protein
VRRGALRFTLLVAAGAGAFLGSGAVSGGQADAASSVATARTQRLLVDVVAYSLPGQTSSGRPVARGVVAVDPRIIPLGTRLHIPGYGKGVAADTGTAIRGHLIDVWFPTLAEARAWGRKTITITVYR